ncbi:hypothetical protein WJX74_008283 [Apatococcus lobatus]|uniref:Uncharacterized protein n=1 Tax=Apatococcus lobatus TaxID=904363 RepID=A0AAW1QJW1_9CHLO
MGPASSPSKAAAPSSSIADGKNSSLNPADHGFPRWATALVVALLAGAAMFAIVFGALAWRNRREGTGGGAREVEVKDFPDLWMPRALQKHQCEMSRQLFRSSQ